jgi:hypothetical protein
VLLLPGVQLGLLTVLVQGLQPLTGKVELQQQVLTLAVQLEQLQVHWQHFLMKQRSQPLQVAVQQVLQQGSQAGSQQLALAVQAAWLEVQLLQCCLQEMAWGLRVQEQEQGRAQVQLLSPCLLQLAWLRGQPLWQVLTLVVLHWQQEQQQLQPVLQELPSAPQVVVLLVP